MMLMSTLKDMRMVNWLGNAAPTASCNGIDGHDYERIQPDDMLVVSAGIIGDLDDVLIGGVNHVNHDVANNNEKSGVRLQINR